jgi:hypothetical protein
VFDVRPGVELDGCPVALLLDDLERRLLREPSAAPVDCVYAIADGAATTCSVSGATFAATTQEVLLAMHTTAMPPCGAVTTAVTLGTGAVAKQRDDWC